jgi:hypothetical protein
MDHPAAWDALMHLVNDKTSLSPINQEVAAVLPRLLACGFSDLTDDDKKMLSKAGLRTYEVMSVNYSVDKSVN